MHKLIPIREAYDTALGESRRDDPVLAAKKAAINQQLYKLDDKLKEVNMNFAAVEQQLVQVRYLCCTRVHRTSRLMLHCRHTRCYKRPWRLFRTTP
jgi:hypothetical protein